MGQITLGEQATPVAPSSGITLFPTIATPSILRWIDDASNERTVVGASSITAWTPGVAFGGGTTGITYAANGQVGRYVRLAPIDVILAWGYIELTAKGSSTGSATLTGLPIAALNVTNLFAPVVLRPGTLTGITGMVQGAISPGGTTISLTFLGTGAHAAVTDANFQNTSHFMVFAAYLV